MFYSVLYRKAYKNAWERKETQRPRSPRHCQHKHTHARRVFASSFSTGPPGDRGALHCRWNVIATQPLGLVSFQARGILPVAEEQSRTRGSQSGGVEDQPQCRGLWHSSRPSARSLSHSPSHPPPSWTQCPSPPRSLVCDGQPSPHRPRLVVSRSTCRPLVPWVRSSRATEGQVGRHSPTPSSRGFGLHIHCGVEVTESSTNKQHSLTPVCVFITPCFRLGGAGDDQRGC